MEKTVKTVRRRPGTVRMGFTVIEIVLVVAILGIMASIVIPRMGLSTMGEVQAKTTARKFANYLKLTRILAITNASGNNKGYELKLSPEGGPYTSYEIKNEDTGATVKGPIDIPSGVACTGDRVFEFIPLGQLDGSVTQTVQFSKAGATSTVTVTAIGRIMVH